MTLLDVESISIHLMKTLEVIVYNDSLILKVTRVVARCWGPKCDKKAHSMKSKERPQVLTKKSPVHDVKKDHEGPKAQKEGRWKKK